MPDYPSEDIDYDEAEVDDSDIELHRHTSSAADSEHTSAISDSTIDELQTLCDALLNDSASVDEVLACETLKTVHDSIQQFKDHLTISSRTAALWVQYMEYINVIKLFIRAERTGDWNWLLEKCLIYLQPLATTTMPNPHVCTCK